jgi:hypothetical protein
MHNYGIKMRQLKQYFTQVIASLSAAMQDTYKQSALHLLETQLAQCIDITSIQDMKQALQVIGPQGCQRCLLILEQA